jgi:alpha-ribazole phosphatase
VAKEIVFIRHSSLAVPRGMCYGFSNIDVSHEFSLESDWLKSALGGFDPQLVITSPLQRCLKLSVEVFDAPITVEENLKEVNYGNWEGKTWGEINVEGDNLWMYKNVNNCPPNGESFSELKSRVVKVLDKILDTELDRVAVVCHGGVIRSVLSHLLSTPLDKTRSFHIHYVGFVKFVKTDEGYRLAELNSGYK